MKAALTFTSIAIFGLGLLAGGALEASRSAEKPKLTTLLQTPLAEEFTPGREVLVDLVEVPPNASLERHWHPGEEFHYYLEGDGTIELDGEPPIAVKPGTVGHIPFKKWHRAVAGEKGAKVIVFRVHTKGEPSRYVDEETPRAK